MQHHKPFVFTLTESYRAYFADEWKTALVTPLLKKQGLELSFPNYRPVSNLSFVSKLVERASVNQLTSHMEQNFPLPSHQSAYRSFHSTETALIKVQSDILLNMDSQKLTLLVMLDLSAAFDTIDHTVMIETLDHETGTTGVALDWFASYLKGRTQKVQISGSHSRDYHLRYGVPLGSCLGPLLFTVYAASLFKVLGKHLPEAHGYADDHQLYLAFKPDKVTDEDRALSALQDCINDVRQWMLSNKLKINDKKTEFLILGSKQQLEKVNTHGIYVGNEQVAPVRHVRNLGALFDENLTMDKHIAKVCGSGYSHLHNIRAVRKYLTHEAVCSIVHAFISSQLDYCNSLLSGLPSYLIGRLQRLQNSAARVVCNLRKYDHISSALRRLHWLPVKYRIQFKVILIVFKALHNMAPKYILDMLVRKTTGPYRLRSDNAIVLRVPRYKCVTFGRRAFAVNAPMLWNALPSDLRQAVNIDIFKNKLKSHLFEKFIKDS